MLLLFQNFLKQMRRIGLANVHIEMNLQELH